MKKDYLKCPFNYAGNKYKLLEHLDKEFNKIEKIDTFYDVFGGGMTVSLNIEANKIIATDIIKEIIDLNNFLLNVNKEEFKNEILKIIDKFNLSKSFENGTQYYLKNNVKIAKTGKINSGLDEYNKKGYLELRKEYNKTKSSILLYVLLVYSFNYQMRFNSKNEFNMPVGRGDWNIQMQEKLFKYIENIQKKNIEFKIQSFENIDENLIKNLNNNDLFYFDPPYLISTAVYNESDGWNNKHEEKLLTILELFLKYNKKFVLSNVLTHNSKTNELLNNFIQKNKDFINLNIVNEHKYTSFGSTRKHKEENNTQEIIISNF